MSAAANAAAVSPPAATGAQDTGIPKQSEAAAATRKRGRAVGVEPVLAVMEAEEGAPAARPTRRAKVLANAAISASGAARSRGQGGGGPRARASRREGGPPQEADVRGGHDEATMPEAPSGVDATDVGRTAKEGGLSGTLVRRPSSCIKTPYVADVRLLTSPPTGTASAAEAVSAAADRSANGGSEEGLVLAHAPALDCAGMVTPGCTVYLSASAAVRREGAPPTATSHAIQLVEDQRPGGEVAVVGSHPQLAEKLAAEMLRRRCLQAALGPYEAVETQKTYGNTRVDFVLRMADGSSTLLEVKNVVCADFPEGGVPPGRPRVGVYTAPVPPDGTYRPTALFPHGAQKPKIKVVSDRAIKHVWELTELHKTGGLQQRQHQPEAEGKGAEAPQPREVGLTQPPSRPPALRCAVLFVVNRSDCVAFRPCHEADPLFAQVLKAAQEAGVTLLAYDITWRGGQALLGKQLPVVFGADVIGSYDPARLAEVLDFNATDPRKNWKSGSGKGGKGGSPRAKKKTG